MGTVKPVIGCLGRLTSPSGSSGWGKQMVL